MAHFYREILYSRIVAVQEFRNTFYYYTDNPALISAGMSSIIDDWMIAVWKNIVVDIAQAYQCSWEYLDGSNEWQPIRINLKNVYGTRSTPTCPLTVAAVVCARTNKRRTIGRKFLGPISTGDQAGGIPSATLLTNMTAFGTFYVGTQYPGDGFGYIPHTWSKLHGGFPLLQAFNSALLGSWRRRRIGQGI